MKKLIFTLLSVYAMVYTAYAQVLWSTTENGGPLKGGTIFTFDGSTKVINPAKTFYVDGTTPYGSLMQANDGKFYGTTSYGGGDNSGTLFSYDPATGTYTQLVALSYEQGYYSYGRLLQASNGILYGLSESGGPDGYGVIFSYDIASATYTILHSFDFPNDGGSPYGSLIQFSDGKLYGMTEAGGSNNAGTVFSINPDGSAFTVVHVFDYNNGGGSPYGSLLQVGSKLYGLTSSGGSNNYGTLFSIDPATPGDFTTLYNFNEATGSEPEGSLIQASDNKLYGTTTAGGSGNNGVVFSYDLSTGYTVIQDFGDGSLGGSPYADLFEASDHKLYGMTYSGGNDNDGVIFSYDINASSNQFSKLRDFTYNDSAGVNPDGNFIEYNGKLYAFASYGGVANGGTLFSYDISTSAATAYSKLKDFGTNEDGSELTGALYRATDGKLYGATSYGGNYGKGVLFSYDPDNEVFKKLKDFGGEDGENVYGNLLQVGNKLYGMTGYGGIYGAGTIFSYDITTSTYTKLYDFDSYTGVAPKGGFLQGAGNKLYALTYYGGTSDAGVLFSYDTESGNYNKLYDFDYATGINPAGSLTAAPNGLLYGLTSYNYDGSYNGGTIFSFDTSSLVFNVVHYFGNYSTPDGNSPYGNLTLASDNKLYGLTYLGGNNSSGVIFSYDPATTNYAKLYDFKDRPDGTNPNGSLMQASDGRLYGLTVYGGTKDSGTVFSYDFTGGGYQKLQDFTSDNGAYPYSYFIEVPCTTQKTFYKDADKDGYGDLNNTVQGCAPPTGYVRNSTDCDDSDKNTHPGAPEKCDGIDNNCDGVIDEGCPIPKFRIYDASIYEGNSGQKKMKFRVALSDSAYRTLTVHYKTVNNTATASSRDYIATQGTLTFNKGDKRQFITVLINGDILLEPDETFKVKLSAPVNATIKDGTAVGTILTDENTPVIGLPLAKSSTSEERGVVVAPNPAAVTANVRMVGFSGNTTLQILTLEGRLLKTIKANGTTSQQINVADLAGGTYFLTVIDEEGFKETVKLVVLH